MALLVLLASFAATGWLYLLRGLGSMPGPQMTEALPLDELPGHAAIGLLPFVVVWGTAGVLLGLAARVLRVRRLHAVVFFTLGTALLLMAATWFSIFVVRQIPGRDALHAALGSASVYTAATLVAVGAALPGLRIAYPRALTGLIRI